MTVGTKTTKMMKISEAKTATKRVMEIEIARRRRKIKNGRESGMKKKKKMNREARNEKKGIAVKIENAIRMVGKEMIEGVTKRKKKRMTILAIGKMRKTKKKMMKEETAGEEVVGEAVVETINEVRVAVDPTEEISEAEAPSEERGRLLSFSCRQWTRKIASSSILRTTSDVPKTKSFMIV